MRHALAMALMVLSIAGPGCALIEDSCHNIANGVKTPIEEHREKARNREWAEAAWRQLVCSSGGPGRAPYSEDYADGFKQGFAEYLYRGGDGEPPLVAPKRYRDFRYQNEAGYRAVEDWFAGYRHGVTMARDSGARKWIVGPSSLLPDAGGMAPPPEGPPPLQERPRFDTPLPQPVPESKIEEIPIPPLPLATKPAAQRNGQQLPKLPPIPEPAASKAVDEIPLPPFLRDPDQTAEHPAPKSKVEEIAVPAVAPIGVERTPSVQKQAEPIGQKAVEMGPPKAQAEDPGTALPDILQQQIRLMRAAALKSPEPVACEPEPLPEALRLRIQKLSGLNAPEEDHKPASARIRITAVDQETPPPRPRVTGIIATPQKD